MAKTATKASTAAPAAVEETCTVCGSAICLTLSRNHDAQREANAELRARSFANPASFGAIEQATNVCSTTGRQRP